MNKLRGERKRKEKKMSDLKDFEMDKHEKEEFLKSLGGAIEREAPEGRQRKKTDDPERSLIYQPSRFKPSRPIPKRKKGKIFPYLVGTLTLVSGISVISYITISDILPKKESKNHVETVQPVR